MVQVGAIGGKGHLPHPQGEGHSVLMDLGHGVSLVSFFSLSSLSFSLYFSSSPVVSRIWLTCSACVSQWTLEA